jgi:hypothetical protein
MIVRKVGPALALLAILSGCGDALPNDEQIDQAAAKFEASEGKKIRQKAVGDPTSDGFSYDEEVDPNYEEPEPDANAAEEETSSEEPPSDGSQEDLSGW